MAILSQNDYSILRASSGLKEGIAGNEDEIDSYQYLKA